jgi:hypothetical protein
MKVKGIDGMSGADLQREIQMGGRFVIFQYCISILIMTFRRPTDIFFIPAGEKAWSKSIPYCIVSLFLGWWGLPWGLIYTPATIFTNLGGGKDVTNEIMQHFASGNQDFSDIENANS